MGKLSELVKGPDKELPTTHQILVDVRFKRKDGVWADKMQMILDTGAVISMLPMAWYYELEASESVEYKLYGVNSVLPAPDGCLPRDMHGGWRIRVFDGGCGMQGCGASGLDVVGG